MRFLFMNINVGIPNYQKISICHITFDISVDIISELFSETKSFPICRSSLLYTINLSQNVFACIQNIKLNKNKRNYKNNKLKAFDYICGTNVDIG